MFHRKLSDANSMTVIAERCELFFVVAHNAGGDEHHCCAVLRAELFCANIWNPVADGNIAQHRNSSSHRGKVRRREFRQRDWLAIAQVGNGHNRLG